MNDMEFREGTDRTAVPYIVHEGSMARMERMIKRLMFALILAVMLIFVSNALWLYEWMRYDYVAEDVAIDSAGGPANYIGNDGEIYNGEDQSKADSPAETEE